MNLAPLPVQKFFGNDGKPLVSGRLFTYGAGTDIKVPTYIDSSGNTQNENPIRLDFRAECRLWIDPTLSYKFVLAPPDDTDPPSNPIWTVDNITSAPLSRDNAAVDSGIANSIILSLPSIASLSPFLRVVFQAAATNTGAAQLTINGLPPNPIRWQNRQALSGGELQQDGIYEVIYDGAYWQLQGPTLLPPLIRTAAEIAAGITPTNFGYPELARLRYASTDDLKTVATYILANTPSASIGASKVDGYGVFGNGTFNTNNAAGDPPHILEIINDNSNAQCLRLSSYGASAFSNNVHFCRYNGTEAAPTAITNLQAIMSIGYRGWDGSGALSQSAASFQCHAIPLGGGSWTPTDNGCRFLFQVTRPGSSALSRQDALYISDAGIGVGSWAPSAWDPPFRAVEFSPGCAVRGNNAEPEIALVANGIYTSTGWKYAVDGASSLYQMDENIHVWSNAATGVHDAALTFVEVMRIRTDGYWSVGGAGAASGRAYHNILSSAVEGNTILLVRSETTADTSLQVNAVDADGHNAAQAAVWVGKNSSTSRSINAGGTVNASGADYAEYETKREDCGEIAKGDIVGFDADGLLTDKWSQAVTFGIKSTAPSYVGGDDWGAGLEGEALELARSKVDRIVYAGKVPCNVFDARPGEYILAAPGENDSIVGICSIASSDTGVGRVRRILPDGRAQVVV